MDGILFEPPEVAPSAIIQCVEVRHATRVQDDHYEDLTAARDRQKMSTASCRSAVYWLADGWQWGG